MKPEPVIIIGLLIVIAIQLVIIFLILKISKKRYKTMEGRCATYLDELDRENQRLKTGKIALKARKNYSKLIVD